MEEGKVPSSNSTRKHKTAEIPHFVRNDPHDVTPRSDSEEGSPIQLRGLDITPSKLPQENIKKRRSFASLRMTMNGGGISPLLQLHPKI